MTAQRAPQVRGACPGALEPMESGDGLIVRVRPHVGTLSVAALHALAVAAHELGNGAIDLTRRANVQLRGLSNETLPAMRDCLAGLGLLDESASAERLRNIMLSPLAGLDTAAPGFVVAQGLARELEAALAHATDLAPLSAKFGFLIDDGGAHLSIAGEASDIRLRVMSAARVALGLDIKGGTRWLGEADVHEAASHATDAARAFLRLAAQAKAKRLRECTHEMADAIRRDLGLTALTFQPQHQNNAQRLGVIEGAGTPLAVVLGAPFGRIDAADLSEFASTLVDLGIEDVRVTPWRAIAVPASNTEAADLVLAAGLAHGFLTRDADPLTRIDACPGAPACPCGAADTRAAARNLASLWPRLGLASAHVSGCTKGCARSEKADLVLVGRGDHFDLIRHGRADAQASGTQPLTLEGLAEALAANQGS